MTVRVKDIDGNRELELEIRGGVAFLAGPGFCYEFDVGIIWHAWKREMSRDMGVDLDSVPMIFVGGATELTATPR